MMKFVLLALFSCFFFGCTTAPGKRNCAPQGFRWGDQKFEINISRYGGNSSAKSLIIVPPTGRTNYIDRRYAEQFCKAGFDSYVMDSWTGDFETTIEIEIHQRFYSNAQKAIGALLDQIESPYIGLIGTSVGGLHAAVAASNYERLNAVFVIAAGIPISEVIVNSDQEAMVNLKEARKARYGYKDSAENIEGIQKVFSFEPTTLPPLYLKKDLGVSIGLQDGTVPTQTQNQLKDFWKPIKVITFENDHFWTIVKTWLLKSDEVLEFFEQSYQKQLLLKSKEATL